MIAWDGGQQRRQHPAAAQRFQPELTYLFVLPFVPSFRFSWLIGTKDNHAYFADAPGHGSGLSSVKCKARPHMDVWDMTSTLCSLRTGAHPQWLIVLAQGQIAY
jgi:hypothetical protein